MMSRNEYAHARSILAGSGCGNCYLAERDDHIPTDKQRLHDGPGCYHVFNHVLL